jgi:LysM repeat protein
MNNPNPFVPKGSLLEQQSQRRSRLKLAVFCVLSVCVVGLVGMLIQGCKRETPPEATLAATETNPPVLTDTNPPVLDTNPPIVIPPPPTNPPVAVETAGSEYLVVKGDTLEKIAKAHGVTLKALQAANPTADSKHLQIKQKLTIPASVKAAEVAPVVAGADAGGETYTVKNNDTLTKIAHNHGVSLKALKAANNLTTDHIKVKQVLKIPAKTQAAAPAPVEPALTVPAAAPLSVPSSAPATTPAK